MSERIRTITTPEQRAKALAQAQGIMTMLEQALPLIDPSTEEFERACGLYAQGVAIKAMIQSRGESK